MRQFKPGWKAEMWQELNVLNLQLHGRDRVIVRVHDAVKLRPASLFPDAKKCWTKPARRCFQNAHLAGKRRTVFLWLWSTQQKNFELLHNPFSFDMEAPARMQLELSELQCNWALKGKILISSIPNLLPRKEMPIVTKWDKSKKKTLNVFNSFLFVYLKALFLFIFSRFFAAYL